MGVLQRSNTTVSTRRRNARRRAARQRTEGWLGRLQANLKRLNPENLFARKRPPPAPRSVYFNEPLPSEAFDKKGKPHKHWQFPTNQLLTARYTIYNFFFKNLWEQYHRVANMFFTLIVVLQFFPKFATISPGLAMLPLLVVLAVTMIKDGYEDWRRHISDRSINNAKVRVLIGGGWTNPNVTESKQRSLKSALTAFWDQTLGGKKRQQKKMEQHAQDISSHHESASVNGPAEPPADAPGGGAAAVRTVTQDSGMQSSLAGHDLTRQRTSMSSLPAGMTRRASTMGGSEYEHLDDGRIKHKGKILSPEEEAKFWEKRSPRWKKRNWEDLRVGDFVLLKNNDPIPADVIVCATSEEEDCCYIETKNLDGETNLKVRHAVPELATQLRSANACAEALMRVDAEPQDTNMYRLNASVILGDRFDQDGNPLRCPVTINQILLRGCNLRNSKWVIGLVLMTGADTKIIANSGNTPTKRGQVERLMNPMVYINLLILAAMAIGCAIADARIENYYFDRTAYWEFYAIFSDDNPNLNGLVTFGNSLITFQNIVPISLYISIEVVRTIQAYFIFDDYDIYYEKTNRRTIARSWNLADDLGQIEYIFSDKTGTLTQNLMIFRECSIGTALYTGQDNETQTALSDSEKVPSSDETGSLSSSAEKTGLSRKRVKRANAEVSPFKDSSLNDALRQSDNTDQDKILGWFWRLLALCHTVVTGEDEETGELEFKAQSPDEEALVQAAADVGFTFCGKERNTLIIQIPSGERERYELLTVLEFSSVRKRMSVIVKRESDNKIFLLTKGADSVIFERTAAGQDSLKASTDQALEEFANKGLRTLCLGFKSLTDEEYNKFAQAYHEASVAMERREERMQDLASDMERDLVLLGSTAIEDRLQEGVPETIADLKRAGINVWVATGDKLETAIAIGYSTMLLSQDMNLIVIRGGEYGQPNSAYNQLKRAIEQFFGGSEVLEQMVYQPPAAEDDGEYVEGRPSMQARRSTASATSLVGEDNGQRSGGYALVIDGSALGHALSEEFSKELLLEISTKCKAVICCRVSPLQKALIVKLIRDGLGVMTLAIGDGANDVSMIQAAHVGIGIAGEEGLQAVNSSDYAIAQFRFLKRLLLVHGHWSYHRNGTMIINFFYKNQINIFTLFFFQIYCAWSSTQVMDYVYLLFWNAFWTVAAVIAMGIFDRILPDHVLMAVPELYARSREHKYFGIGLFMIYLLDAIWQAAVCYFLIMYSYNTTASREAGYSIPLWEWSTTLAMASVLVANLFVGLDMRAWNWWIFAGVWLGPFLIFIFAPIYAAFPPSLIWTYSYGNNQRLYHSALYWFSGILVVIVALIPKFIWRHVRSIYFPTDIEIMRQIEKFDPQHDFIHDPAMPNVRAAKEYGLEIPQGHPDSLPADQQQLHGYPMAPLGHVMSRASSIQHDMLTDSHTPVRGYSFSADDPKPKRKSTIRERLLPSGLRNTLSKRRTKRLSTIRHSDTGHEDIHETEEGDNVQEFGQVEEEPGPEAESEDEDEPEEEQQQEEQLRQPTMQERVEDTLLRNTRGQMNGPMSTNQ